ncbi:MAG TPA: UbiD family decarboxylase domain-containing protein, partial [Fimbriimonadaceae bacterium]|nr:UbiD family decarboxylase domain-containing protein [Fimbriimonadaceae bacterium]
MAWSDYREFLGALEKAGELKRITEAVSPYLEVTEIADRVMKSGGPALLFETVVGPPHRLGTPDPRSAVMGMPSILSGAGEPLTPALPQGGGSSGSPSSLAAAVRAVSEGASTPSLTLPQGGGDWVPLESVRYEHPIAINTMGSRKRMSMALSCDDFEEHAERIAKLLPPPVPKSAKDALKFAVDAFKEVKDAIPRTVRDALCQEVVMQGDEIDLRKLPILTCWPEDGGPFITLPLVFTYDPNTGKRNVGMYRMQLYDRNTCGMHWQMHKTGMRHMEDSANSPRPSGGEGSGVRGMQVAVALGGDPAYTFSAISPLPPGLDEMAFAGFLRRKSAELVPCKMID